MNSSTQRILLKGFDLSRPVELAIFELGWRVPTIPPEAEKYYLPSLSKLTVAWIRNMPWLFHLIDSPILETIDTNGGYLGNWLESLSNTQSDINPWNVFETVRTVIISFDSDERYLQLLSYFPCLTHLTLRFTLFKRMRVISLIPLFADKAFANQTKIEPRLTALLRLNYLICTHSTPSLTIIISTQVPL